jgi:multidrug efflux pump subunit AcrB
MGFLRGLAKGLAGVIFLLLLFGLLINITLYESTKYDSLKPILTTMLSKTLENQNMTPIYNNAQEKCGTQSSYNLLIGDSNVTLECSKIKSSNQQEFAKSIAETLFDQQLYNRQCNGIDCLKLQDIPGFATRSFNEFLKIALFVLAGAVVLFGIFLFLLSKGLQSKLSSLGTPFILVGISAIPLEFFKQKMQMGDFQIFFDKLTMVISKYMLASLAIGIILVAAGIAIAIKNRKKKKSKKKGRKK